MKWYLVYWNDEAILRLIMFDSKGKARSYEQTLPEDYVVVGMIYGRMIT
jgi:hypothetical protein